MIAATDSLADAPGPDEPEPSQDPLAGEASSPRRSKDPRHDWHDQHVKEELTPR